MQVCMQGNVLSNLYNITKLIVNLILMVLHRIFSYYIHQFVVLQESSCHLLFGSNSA